MKKSEVIQGKVVGEPKRKLGKNQVSGKVIVTRKKSKSAV